MEKGGLNWVIRVFSMISEQKAFGQRPEWVEKASTQTPEGRVSKRKEQPTNTLGDKCVQYVWETKIAVKSKLSKHTVKCNIVVENSQNSKNMEDQAATVRCLGSYWVLTGAEWQDKRFSRGLCWVKLGIRKPITEDERSFKNFVHYARWEVIVAEVERNERFQENV